MLCPTATRGCRRGPEAGRRPAPHRPQGVKTACFVRKVVSAKPLVAILDFAIVFRDSLLRLFYRGRLGFPWTRAQRLGKTKDVAARDRLIGVGPKAPSTDERKVLPVCLDSCVTHVPGLYPKLGPARVAVATGQSGQCSYRPLSSVYGGVRQNPAVLFGTVWPLHSERHPDRQTSIDRVFDAALESRNFG